jgi:glycosyltransferase involved in cell wall biosynthesis
MKDSLAASRPIVFTEIAQFGGAERSLLALSAWLHRRGLSHYLLTYFDHCNLAQYASHPVTVVTLNPGRTARQKIAALKQHFAERGLSLWQPLLSGYQPALHGTLAGLRSFHVLMHDTPSLFGNHERRSIKQKLRIGLSNRIIGWGLRSGGRTIVTSEYLRAECRKDFGIDAAIARMGGLPTKDKPRLRTVDRQLNLLSVCRIESNKRIDWILRALSALEQAAPRLSERIDWQLHLAGNGSQMPALREMSSLLGIEQRVHFHGFVPDEDLASLYEQAHLFLMPAIQGYGIPAIESLARGVPVLLHRESGVSDLLLDTPWATVLEGDERQMLPALAKAIDRAIHSTHHAAPLPALPTEDDWASRVVALCNWIA